MGESKTKDKGSAALLAIDRKIALQDLPYLDLRQRLLQDGQILQAQR